MNATALLEKLNTRDIAERIAHLTAERKAMMTLLRAARARERAQRTAKSRTAQEGRHDA